MSGPVVALMLTEPFDDTVRTTGGFAPEFGAEVSDAYGEQLVPILRIRLNDGAGGTPSTLVLPTEPPPIPALSALFGDETMLAVNPIVRKRDVEFGIIQGGAWQIKVTNNNDWFSQYDYRGCWAAINGDLPNLGFSSIFASGKITRVSYETDGTIMFEIQESVMDILNYELPRDIRFQSTGWLSDMSVDQRASGSKSYDTTYLTDLDPADYNDETFVVEFTTASLYKVILEDGDETQTSLISANLDVDNVLGGTNVLRIGSAGWNQAGGSYAAGDRFVFYTAGARTTTLLTPVWMVSHLLDDVMGLTAYDVTNGAPWPSVRYDSAQWATKSSDFSDHAVFGIQGFWRKGTPYSRLIQDALKVVHGSIFPSQDGRIELWVLDAGAEVSLELNGNPSEGSVDIISARSEQDMRDVVSEVTFSYLSMTDGAAASFTATDSAPTWLQSRFKAISIGWETQGLAIQSACNIYLSRFKEGIQRQYLTTTLTGAAAEIGKQVRFSDSVIGASSVQSDIVEVAVDLIGNSAAIAAYIDPVVLQDFAKVDVSVVGGTEVVW